MIVHGQRNIINQLFADRQKLNPLHTLLWNFMAIEQHDAQQIQLKQIHLPNLAICQDGI